MDSEQLLAAWLCILTICGTVALGAFTHCQEKDNAQTAWVLCVKAHSVAECGPLP